MFRTRQSAAVHFAAQLVHQALGAFGAQTHISGLGVGQGFVCSHGGLRLKGVLYTSDR